MKAIDKLHKAAESGTKMVSNYQGGEQDQRHDMGAEPVMASNKAKTAPHGSSGSAIMADAVGSGEYNKTAKITAPETTQPIPATPSQSVLNAKTLSPASLPVQKQKGVNRLRFGSTFSSQTPAASSITKTFADKRSAMNTNEQTISDFAKGAAAIASPLQSGASLAPKPVAKPIPTAPAAPGRVPTPHIRLASEPMQYQAASQQPTPPTSPTPAKPAAGGSSFGNYLRGAGKGGAMGSLFNPITGMLGAGMGGGAALEQGTRPAAPAPASPEARTQANPRLQFGAAAGTAPVPGPAPTEEGATGAMPAPGQAPSAAPSPARPPGGGPGPEGMYREQYQMPDPTTGAQTGPAADLPPDQQTEPPVDDPAAAARSMTGAWDALKSGDIAGAWGQTPPWLQGMLGAGGIGILMLLLSKMFGKRGSASYSREEIEHVGHLLDRMSTFEKTSLWAEVEAQSEMVKEAAVCMAKRYSRTHKASKNPGKRGQFPKGNKFQGAKTAAAFGKAAAPLDFTGITPDADIRLPGEFQSITPAAPAPTIDLPADAGQSPAAAPGTTMPSPEELMSKTPRKWRRQHPTPPPGPGERGSDLAGPVNPFSARDPDAPQAEDPRALPELPAQESSPSWWEQYRSMPWQAQLGIPAGAAGLGALGAYGLSRRGKDEDEEEAMRYGKAAAFGKDSQVLATDTDAELNTGATGGATGQFMSPQQFGATNANRGSRRVPIASKMRDDMQTELTAKAAAFGVMLVN
jgi:hypothetical protein